MTLKKNIEKLIRYYRWKSVALAIDLNQMTERDIIIRDALDRTIYDLEVLIGKEKNYLNLDILGENLK